MPDTPYEFRPDAIATVCRPEGLVQVHLVEGGEMFPWTAHQGKVIIGPPSGVASDGTPLDSLAWNVDPYWVVEAFDHQGKSVDLTPEEYAKVVRRSE